MFKYRGGQEVTSGTYWCPVTGEVLMIPKVGGILPGASNRPYVRAPAVLLAVAAPFLGLAYVIFLPLSGFAAVIMYVGFRGWQRLKVTGSEMWRAVAPNRQPR